MKTWRVLTRFLAAFVFVVPLIVYLSKFGATISSDHARWAEFGSAMSGIYSPLLTLATLAVFVLQVRMQGQLNTHQFDQAYLQQARSDIDFYLTRLDQYLQQQSIRGFTPQSLLHDHFQQRVKEDLLSEKSKQLAIDIDNLSPKVLAAWFAIYPILEGLQSNKQSEYRLVASGSIQKLIAVLSFETCASLDNFHFARTEGRLRAPYQFSPLVRIAQ